MKLDQVRRLAMQILKTGNSNIWMNPEKTADLKGCMTKEDVREQIKQGHIRKRQLPQQSRGAARLLKAKQKRGRKRGFGKRRGTYKARMKKKETWIKMVRGQRKHLQELKKTKKVSGALYSKLYKLVKGGYFKGKRYIDQYIKDNK